jgi:hypothetical protein
LVVEQGVISSYADTDVVLMAFGITMFIVLGLTAFACQVRGNAWANFCLPPDFFAFSLIFYMLYRRSMILQ